MRGCGYNLIDYRLLAEDLDAYKNTFCIGSKLITLFKTKKQKKKANSKFRQKAHHQETFSSLFSACNSTTTTSGHWLFCFPLLKVHKTFIFSDLAIKKQRKFDWNSGRKNSQRIIYVSFNFSKPQTVLRSLHLWKCHSRCTTIISYFRGQNHCIDWPLTAFKLKGNMCVTIHTVNGSMNDLNKSKLFLLSAINLVLLLASTPRPFVRGEIVMQIFSEKYLVADMAAYLMFGLFLRLDVTLQTLFT